MKKIITLLFRSSVAVAGGLWASQWASSPWGMLVAPALMGISKSVRVFFDNKNKHLPPQERYPWWVKVLPV